MYRLLAAQPRDVSSGGLLIRMPPATSTKCRKSANRTVLSREHERELYQAVLGNQTGSQ